MQIHVIIVLFSFRLNLVIVSVVYYLKIVVRMPPTNIEVVVTPSITRQNVMIILILLSLLSCFI